MKVLLTGLFLLVTIGFSYSQERYRIVYDYKTDRLNFYSIDQNNRIIDTLRNPKFKRNRAIEVQLKNVNPFAVDVSTSVVEKNVHESSGSSGFTFNSLLGSIGKLTGDKLKLNTSSLPLGEKESPTAASRGAALSNKLSELDETTTYVSAIKSALVADLVNPDLNKDSIIRHLKQIAGKLEDIRLPDPDENFYLFLSHLEKVILQDKNELLSSANAFVSEIEQPPSSDEPLSRGQLVARHTTLSNLQNAIASVNSTTDQTTDHIGQIKALYTDLEAASFDQTYDYVIEADKATIELKFLRSAFASQNSSDPTRQTVKTRNVRVAAKGGFKINTGIAMTLNNFSATSNSYFISDAGIIGSEKNTNFVPNLSTMINFYPIISESFNIGGSFGLSVPITDKVGGVNFLLGPSLFIGDKNRLSFSGGIACGPVNKLSNGLKPGDATDIRDLENYTKSVYNFGYYLGVSFSVFDIN